VFRIPQPLYRAGLGWIFGHAFLLLIHRGRRSGKMYETALKVLTYDTGSREAIVFSAWGDSSDWVRNILTSPALEVRIGRQRFVPTQRFLSEDEATSVVATYHLHHPRRLRLLSSLLGWGDLGSDAAVREFVRGRPFVSLRPAEGGTLPGPRSEARCSNRRRA
jgi:deazaflavin-dependent oxidoreductase (nitroreductase family)